MSSVNPPPQTLQEVLDNIWDVCDEKGVSFYVEKKIGGGEGARIRIAYYQPVKKFEYMTALTAGDTQGVEDVIEEECLFEIDWNGAEWEHEFTLTMQGRSNVLERMKSKLEGALAEDKPAEKKPEYDSPASRPGRRQDNKYKWARARLAEGHDVEELYWDWAARFNLQHNSALLRRFRKAMRYKPKT
ncbi:MAG: hypothetical protein QGG60_07695 [Anaerolineales bacterium]|jgi:hypothetical protein|nr:hypothetical protein [Anaerolineales bacterium]MDP7644570.1 hypothetical protein [Anaerolineales bacterium]|tara:strand:- start:317 stop:877 length:561 start_codon:yes stop_codon:yes gene_type:complete